MTTVSSGIVFYPAGGESVSYVIPVPSGAVAGDVLMMKIDTAAGTVVMDATPAGVTTFHAQAQNPNANHRDCGLYGYEITSSPPASVTFTFPSAVRGNAVWWLVRGVTLTGAVSSLTSTWQANTTTITAPSITGVPAGASVYGGLSYGSGSAVVNPPASPWVLLQDGDERRGYVASKGVQASAGVTGTAVFGIPAALNTGRAWQLVLPEAGEPPVPPIVAALMSQPPAGATGDVADGASIMPASVASGGPFIFTTDKAAGGGGGLYTLGIDGQIDQSFTGLAANSVDWRDMTGITGWGNQVILLTTDRDTNKLIYAWAHRATGALTAAGATTLAYEPYGTCLYLHSDGKLYAFVADRGAGDTGTHNVRQYLLTPSGATVSAGSVVRTITETGVMEGMAADDGRAQIYISREDYGLYRYSAAPTGPTTATTVDTVGAGNLVADVEDVAFVKRAEGDKIIVSSQGDNSYHVYDVATLAHEQRFTLVEPDGTTPVTGTDGLDALAVPLGVGFPNGLLVVHSSTPDPSRFAFVDLAEVLGTLPLAAEVTFTATSGLTGAPHKGTPASTVLASTSTLTGAPLKATPATMSLVAVSGLSGAPSLARAASVTLTALSGFTGSPQSALPVTVSTGSTSGLVLSPVVARPAAIEFTATSSLLLATSGQHAATVMFESVSTFAGAPASALPAVAAFASASTFTASPTAAHPAAVTFASTSTLTATMTPDGLTVTFTARSTATFTPRVGVAATVEFTATSRLTATPRVGVAAGVEFASASSLIITASTPHAAVVIFASSSGFSARDAWAPIPTTRTLTGAGMSRTLKGHAPTRLLKGAL